MSLQSIDDDLAQRSGNTSSGTGRAPKTGDRREDRDPRTGPPPKPFVHVPPRPTREPGGKPLPTIAEAMAAISGRQGPG
jgi:hypothetical protein